MASGAGGGVDEWARRSREGGKRDKNRKSKEKMKVGFEIEEPDCGVFVKPKGRAKKGRKERERVAIEEEERSLADRLQDEVPVHWYMLEEAEGNMTGDDILEMEVTTEERDGLEPRVVVERNVLAEKKVEKKMEKANEDKIDTETEEKTLSESMSKEGSEGGLQIVVDRKMECGRRVKKLKKNRSEVEGDDEASEESHGSSIKRRKHGGDCGGQEESPGVSGVCEEGI